MTNDHVQIFEHGIVISARTLGSASKYSSLINVAVNSNNSMVNRAEQIKKK